MVTQLNDEVEPLLSPTSPTFRNKKVWYKTASPYWLLPAFIALSITVGLGLTAKVQFYLRAICYDYLKKNQFPAASFSLKFNPINDDDEHCNNADVQAKTSQFLMILNLCSAIPAIFVLGLFGPLSDRKGRKIILLISTIGSILGTLNILLVGNFLETLGTNFLLIGSLIEGITGGILSLTTAGYAYATDCTPPTQRSVVFGWMQGAFFVGIAIGPIIGGWIVEITNNLLSVFYLMFVIYIVTFLYYLFILPESLTEENLLENVKFQQEKFKLYLRSNQSSWFLNNVLISFVYSIFKPLTIFLPSNSIINSDNGKVNAKYSLLFLAIMSALISVAMMGIQSVFLLYTTLVFKWSLIEQGYYLLLMGASRAFVLFILFPTLVSFLKRKMILKNGDYGGGNIEQTVVEDDEKSRKEFILEVWILRLSLLIDASSYAAYGLATSGSMLVGASITASLGVVANPTMKSLQTALVTPSQIGQLLGALSVLESISHIIGPVIFNTLYSIIVTTSPNLIWYSIGIVLGTACLFSFGISPNKYI